MSPVEMKEKMLEYANHFSEENNLFQRFVFIYEYIEFLNSHPSLKEILQKIFDETTRLAAVVEADLLSDSPIEQKGHALFAKEFWANYTRLEVIHGRMKKIQQGESGEESGLEDLQHFFTKPYSDHLLHLSFRVVNTEVFDRLDKLHFRQAAVYPSRTWFDEAKSVVYIKGIRVQINKQDKITNAHKMLRHFFITNKNNIYDDFYYAEIAEQEFHELDYKHRKNNWWMYHRACEVINEKVREQTDGRIADFLISNTGEKGKVKINPKYL